MGGLARSADRPQHATYGYCTSAFLRQAGVANECVYLPTAVITGNGHMPMLESNILDIAGFLDRWLLSKLR